MNLKPSHIRAAIAQSILHGNFVPIADGVVCAVQESSHSHRRKQNQGERYVRIVFCHAITGRVADIAEFVLDEHGPVTFDGKLPLQRSTVDRVRRYVESNQWRQSA